jgi:hypothetical protein
MGLKVKNTQKIKTFACRYFTIGFLQHVINNYVDNSHEIEAGFGNPGQVLTTLEILTVHPIVYFLQGLTV